MPSAGSRSTCARELVEEAAAKFSSSARLVFPNTSPQVPSRPMHGLFLRHLGMNATLAAEQSGPHKYSITNNLLN
jgi:hypothetical protein